MLKIDELIVFNVENTAYWRRQTAERFPEDHRNVEAAEILERLAPELRAIEGTALHGRIAQFAEKDEDGNFSSILSEMLRAIGFQSFPLSGNDFLDEFLINLGLCPELKNLRSISQISNLQIKTIVKFGNKTEEGKLIQSVTVPWLDIIEVLKNDPSAAFQISPNKWEEIIAGAYKKAGFEEVTLTPRSGDRGRDIIAIKKGLGFIRIIDQVKAYKPPHLVTANDVRALCGVLNWDGASKAFLTTTSDFAPMVANDPSIAHYMPSRLELINGKALFERLQKIACQ